MDVRDVPSVGYGEPTDPGRAVDALNRLELCPKGRSVGEVNPEMYDGRGANETDFRLVVGTLVLDIIELLRD